MLRATRYRLAIIFGVAWSLFGLFCLATVVVGGYWLWVFTFSRTLSGRVAIVIYGPQWTSSLLFVVLSLAEIIAIGGAIGLIFEKPPWRITAGASILLAYVAVHMLVAPIGESREVLALRLRSTNPAIFDWALDRIRHHTVDVDLLVEELPQITDNPGPGDNLWLWRSSKALNTLTELKGIEFWKNYLQGAKGQASSARFCENVLASAERTAPPHCRELGIETWSKQLDELTAEVARCYVREVRAGHPEAHKLVVLARYFPWVIDEYRDFLIEELASGDPNWGFGTPSDPRNPCYVQGKRSLLVQGGINLKGKSREELASVLDYWHACPYERWERGSSGRPSGCR
jgi:hypothetical protein